MLRSVVSRRWTRACRMAADTDLLNDSPRIELAFSSRTPAILDDPRNAGLEIAVLVPCHNEAASIAGVVADFSASIPGATVYVYDNNSTDNTVAVAQSRRCRGAPRNHAGQGQCRPPDVRGRGCRRLYPGRWRRHLRSRRCAGDAAAAGGQPTRHGHGNQGHRPGRRLSSRSPVGNAVLTGIVRWIFGNRISDMLSGYRVFSRPVREILSGPRKRLRNRDGVHNSRP